jgi:hypothetical protein
MLSNSFTITPRIGSGLLHYRIVPKRDTEERLLAGFYYDSTGREIRVDYYFYDECGRLIRISMGQIGEWIFEYYGDSSLKRKIGNLSGGNAFGEIFQFQYDDRRLLLRMNHLHHDITVFEYTVRGL